MNNKDWITDANNNRCSIAYFGNEEKARAALASLVACNYCSDCSDCSDCRACSDCSGCNYCSGCRACSDCSNCSDCSGCNYCIGCRACSNCSYCSNCSGCNYCSGCRACSDCSECSDCRACSDCSDCSDCRACSNCSDEERKVEKDFDIPILIDIHKQVYAAASQPQSLDMSNWHTCNTTHCRAGWVVHLAGERGYTLEKQTSALFAAQQIYKASGYNINPCRFFDDNEKTLEDMKKLAEEKNEDGLKL